MTEFEASRRKILYGAAAAGVAAPILAACGSEDEAAGDAAAAPTSADTGGSDAPATQGPAESGIPTSDIPVGGGAIFPDDQYVVTQPSEGDFKAFTAVCTHRQCLVASVSDGSINCTCHGSRFSIEDGSVVNGPATSPLAEKDVKVTGNSLTVS